MTCPTRAILLRGSIVAALVACSHGRTAPTTPTTGIGQVAEGRKLHAEHCAGCHGPAGEGTDKAPRIIGPDALPLVPPAKAKKRTTRFRTAKDVFDFLVKAMPADDPGSLTIEQYLSLLAFALSSNGVDLSGRRLEMATLDELVIHQ